MAVELSGPDGELSPGIDGEGLARVAEAALAALGHPDAELSVVICDDAFIAPLNAEWRQVDGPTDVLSFPQLEFPDGPNQGVPAGEAAVLGDIVISAETAGRQAAEQGHDLDAELAILLVHGLCHLLGWDHEEPADAALMRIEEKRLLSAIGRVDRGLVDRAM
jgi:probable rRNA maturation factor